MKKHLSVLMLMVRSTLYRSLGLLFLMAAIQGIQFYFTVKRAPDGPIGLEQAVAQSGMIWVCAVAFVLYLAVLCLPGCPFGSKPGYTLRRLSIGERSVFFWQAACNVCCLVLFWAVQFLAALALCRLYRALSDPAMLSGQTTFLAFYRNRFLHSLLPLAETSRFLRNLALCFGLGFAAAYFPLRQRQGKISLIIAALAALTLVSFCGDMGSFASDIIVIVLCACSILSILAGVFGKEPQHEEA